MKYILMLACFMASFSLVAEEINGVTFSPSVTGDNWKEGNHFKDEKQELTSFVLENETPDTWTELITTQSVKGLKVKPSQFYDLFLKQLKNLVPNSDIKSKINKDTDHDFSAEWWIDEKGHDDQHEWVHMMRKGDDLILFRYTTKNVSKINEDKRKAMAFMDSIGKPEKAEPATAPAASNDKTKK